MAISRLRHRVFMMAFIASPLVVMVVLVYAILIAFERGPSMVAEPVGAGAGQTGGANAIGQSLFGTGDSGDLGIPAERTARGVELVVRDASGLARTDRPIVLLTNRDGFAASGALPFVQRAAGEWVLRLPAPAAEAEQSEPLAFRLGLGSSGGTVRLAIDEEGAITGARRLPRVPEDEAIGATPLRYEFRVTGFAEDVTETPDPG